MTRTPFFVAWLLAAGPAVGAGAQGLPFRVTAVDWEPAVVARQIRAYRANAGEREILFCVEAWKTVPAGDAQERLVIERVRTERGGGANRITDVGENCLGPNKEPLPMIHTHSDGNCQFSAADLITLVARRAPFEGVQCGPHYFIWEFAWKVLAIANSVELARIKQ